MKIKLFGLQVPAKATVIELKKCIARLINLQMRKKSLCKHIRWKYAWKAYWLNFDGIKLTDDNVMLYELGIENKSEITFVKRLKDKIRIR